MKFPLTAFTIILLGSSIFATERKVLATVDQIEEYGDATRLWLSDITGDVSFLPLGTGNFLTSSQAHLNIATSNQDIWKRYLSIALTAKTTGSKVWLLWDDAGGNRNIGAMKIQ